MPRKARFYVPGVPAHVIQRGNCRQAVFFCEEDYTAYLNWLEEGALKQGCLVHAYVLMTNHVHLLMTPQSRDSISRTMQYVGRHYVTYINHRYGKSGTLWEGRHKGCVISDDDYLLACMRYIELNPVRASMVDVPGAYPWSSYLINAGVREAAIVTPHALYMALGEQLDDRRYAYRELFRNALEAEQVHDIRAAVQTGTPLGSDRFRQQIEQTLNCVVGQAHQGRPRQKKGTDPF